MRMPNLLFLMTDQQRADTIEPGAACHTPNLERLAAVGTRFRRAYTVSPICSPARASLMTGLLPHTHGMVDVTHAVPAYRASFDASLPCWPQLLQRAGYDTAYFGKWHVERSDRLEDFGFDTYEVQQYQQKLGLVEVDNALTMQRVVSHKGYADFPLYGVSDQLLESVPEYQIYSDGIDFLQRSAADPQRPWALFLSTEAPHDPYIALRPYYDLYDPAALLPPASFDSDMADQPALYRRIQRVWQDLDWAEFAQATACYYANCTLIDDQVGRILAALDELELTEDTLIVYTSDHGDYMGDHRLLLKGIPPFEGIYHIPLILSGPGVPCGREVDDLVSLIDLAPTLAELAVGEMFDCHGRSLLPLLGEQPGDWLSEAFAECHGQRFNYTQRILWRGNDKYVFNGFDEDELYDLRADPAETHNLAADPRHQPILESMAARMWQIMHQTNDNTMVKAQYGMFRFAPVGPEAGREGNHGS